jgi:glycosyltransferase involved in cell wall biosynthesis
MNHVLEQRAALRTGDGAASGRNKRLLIVEEGLRGLEIGHWYEHVRTISNACRAAGTEVTIAAHRQASPRLLADLKALPLIPVSVWGEGRPASNALKRYWRVLRHNLALYRTVARLLSAQAAPFDCVFAPTVMIQHLLAWLWLARRHGGRSFACAVLFFLNPPGRCTGPDGRLVFPRSANLMRGALRRLRPHLEAGHVRLGAETRRVAEHFKAFCGVDFEVAPQPVALEKLARAPRQGKPLFACYGFARHEKGSDLLQSALVQLLDRRGSLPARFLIQWREDFTDDAGRRVSRHPRLLGHEDVEFVERAFDTGEYTAHLARTDGMVLPYRRSSYYDRDSRVAIEAAVLGIPTVHTRDTWLEQVATHCGAGVAFQDGDVNDLACAIEELAAHVDRYRDLAEKKAPAARDYFSPARFEEWLMGGRSEPESRSWVVI